MGLLPAPHAGPRTARLRDAFALDPRSLAAARIAVGALLLADLAIRSRDLRAHYTDEGVLPLEPLREQWLDGWRFSVHGLGGSPGFEATLFVLAAAAAVAVLVGWRTRWALVAAWALTVSLQNRNPLVLHGADSLLRALLVWGFFLPWDDRWSLAAKRRAALGAVGSSEPVTTIGTVAWVVQIALVHWLAALLKTGDEWRRSFTAVYYALHIDQYQLPLGELALRLPLPVLRLLTAEVLLAELLVPFLLFGGVVAPRLGERLRAAAAVVLGLLHAGLAATMALGLFPFVSLASFLPLLPRAFWDRFERRRSAWHAGARDPSDPAGGAPASGVPRRRYATAESFAGSVLLLAVVYWNATTLPLGRDLPKPHWLRAAAELVRFDQRWNLFAPRPMTDDGWLVAAARLEGGRLADLFRGGAPVDPANLAGEKPDDVSAELGGYRWRKYVQNLRLSRYERHRGLYASYLCRLWNRDHDGDERAASVRLVYALERTQPPGRAPTVEPVSLGRFTCRP